MLKIVTLACLLASSGCASTSNKDQQRLAEAERRITALEERIDRLTPPPAPSEPTESLDPDAIANFVTKTGAYDYTLHRGALRLGREHAMQDARVVPHYLDNRYVGIKLVGVRPGSFFRAIGIRSGDVIMMVNGVALDSPNKALHFLDVFFEGQDTTVVVEIERRQQPKTLTYTIER